MNSTYDLRNNLGGGVSIQPGTNYPDSADVDGDWIDCLDFEGPIHAECAVASATGSPTAFSINFDLDEADDSSGTGAQKIATQTEVTLTADKTRGIAQGIRTKRYVRVSIDSTDSSFTAGTSPAIDTSANVIGQKKIV